MKELDTIIVGNSYKLFLVNNRRYSGTVLRKDSDFIVIYEIISDKEMGISLHNIVEFYPITDKELQEMGGSK